MATKEGTYNLYTWRDFDYAEFISRYHNICKNWKVEWVEDENEVHEPVIINGIMDVNPFKGTKKVSSIKPLDDDKVIRKCKYLQHSFIVLVHGKAYLGDKEEHHVINYNTTIAVEIIGKHFYPIRRTLIEMGYISTYYVRNIEKYTPFSYSTTYKVKECPITKQQTIDHTIAKYISKLKKKLKERRDKYLEIANLNVDKKEIFIKNYTISLNKFKILDKDKFNEVLSKYNYPDMHIYNNYVINALSEEKEI